MVQTIIEIFYDTDSNGELILAGDPDGTAYENIKPYLTAIEHNMNSGVASTLYRVDDDAPQSAIDDMVATDAAHSDHGVDGGIARGLEIQPGTATTAEVDDLNSRVQNAGGPDLSTATPSNEPSTHIFDDHPGDAVSNAVPTWSNSTDPGAGGGPVVSDSAPTDDLATVIKNDYPSIGSGNWRCIHPDHTGAEINPVGSQCSLGHSDDIAENDYAQQHRSPFDPTGFL